MANLIFEAGDVKTAKARLSNPTTKAFTYTVELYLGVDKAASSGVQTVTIPAEGYQDVMFVVTLPLTERVSPVYLDIKYEGILLKHYQGTDTIETGISPDIIVGPIEWI